MKRVPDRQAAESWQSNIRIHGRIIANQASLEVASQEATLSMTFEHLMAIPTSFVP